MAVPLIYVAALGIRVAAPVIIRYIATHTAKQSAKKYGLAVVRQVTKLAKTYKGKNSSMINAAKLLTKGGTSAGKVLTKTVTKGGKKFKIRYTAKTPKGKNISAKVKAKYKKITPKNKPKPIIKVKPKVKPKIKPKTIVSKTKPKPIIKVKPKVKPKIKPKTIVSRSKTKPIIKVKPKVKPKIKAKKIISRTKPKPIITKAKPFLTKGKLLALGVGGGAIAGMLLTKKKKDTDKKIDVKIRQKPEIPRDKAGPQSGPKVKTKLKDIPGSSQYGVIRTGPQVKKKFTEEREKSFEARVRALVAQKDRLKNIDAGDGRSEYQVRINKLKKENKKAFKKMFTLGGFGKLKD